MLSEDDLLLVETARGFVGLKMWLDAHSTLEAISAENWTAKEVLQLKVAIFHGLEKWELMETVACSLARKFPREPHWLAAAALAKRRGGSDAVANSYVERAIAELKEDAVVLYSLACASCLLGDLKNSLAFLRRAFAVEPELRSMALEDADLSALWENLGTEDLG